MRTKAAELRCQRNPDGTCSGKISINGEDLPGWQVQNGCPMDLRDLFLDFVVLRGAYPTILEPWDGCLDAEFVAMTKEWFDEWRPRPE
jgi:hypothetical protein